MSRPSPSSGPGPDGVPAGQVPGAAVTGPAAAPRRESRYRAYPTTSPAVGPPASEPAAAKRRQGRVLRLALTEPDTAPMSAEQHAQAVDTLAAMIVAWWQRSPAPSQNPDPGPGHPPGSHE